MTLQSFLTAKKEGEMTVIPVFQHKTAEQPALIALHAEDYKRMKLFHENLRQQHNIDEDPSTAPFFVKYMKAEPYLNISKEINCFSKAAGYPKCTSTYARKAAETDMQGSATDTLQQRLVSEYLNHGEGTAKKYYRMDSFCNAVDAQKLIDSLETSETMPLPTTSPSSPSSSIGSTNTSTSSEKERWFAKCFQEFPVTPHGCVPRTKEIRSKVNDIPHNILRCFLTRFRREKERKEIADWYMVNERTFEKQYSKPEQLKVLFEEKKWGLENLAFCKSLHKPKSPRGRASCGPSTQAIDELCFSQKWKGILAFHTQKRGRGLKTSIFFPKGTVVCNYNGKLIEQDTDEYLASGRDTSYMFCLNFLSKNVIIDGKENDGSFGRLINHSVKHPNLRPEKYLANFQNEEKITILFRAVRDIRSGEELLYDYSDWSPNKSKPDWYKICPCALCSP